MIARGVEERFDAFRFGLKRLLGLLDPFEILPYRGYGTSRELFLRGRVLEEAGITRAGRDDAVWKNILNMARRFASDEVAGARVRASSRCASSLRSRSTVLAGGTRSGWSSSHHRRRVEEG